MKKTSSKLRRNTKACTRPEIGTYDQDPAAVVGPRCDWWLHKRSRDRELGRLFGARARPDCHVKPELHERPLDNAVAAARRQASQEVAIEQIGNPAHDRLDALGEGDLRSMVRAVTSWSMPTGLAMCIWNPASNA